MGFRFGYFLWFERTLFYAIHELVDTEEAYIMALEDVIIGYKSAMMKLVESSTVLQNSDVNDVFGNLNEIYSANTLL